VSPVLLRIVLGVLLIIHGVAHVDLVRVWGSRRSASSWLLGQAATLGTVVSMVALAGFVLAGLALVAGFGAWRPLAIAAACVSLVTIALFWDAHMVLGVAVNVGILVALLWLEWPEQTTLGLGR
jgi:hypothetical protein